MSDLPSREEVGDLARVLNTHAEIGRPVGYEHYKYMADIITRLARAVPCQTCEGDGVVLKNHHSGLFSSKVPCPDCNGTGQTYPKI
jgi:hypothetical protein